MWLCAYNLILSSSAFSLEDHVPHTSLEGPYPFSSGKGCLRVMLCIFLHHFSETPCLLSPLTAITVASCAFFVGCLNILLPLLVSTCNRDARCQVLIAILVRLNSEKVCCVVNKS